MRMKPKNVQEGLEDIHFRIMYAMIRMGNFHNQYSQQRRKYGTSEEYYENEMHVLSEIVENNAVNLLDLAKTFYKTKSYISQVISRLEKRKLIVKAKSAADARKTVYTVTPKGLRLYRLHFEYDFAESRCLLEHLAEFSKAELELFIRMLEKYHQFQLEEYRCEEGG